MILKEKNSPVLQLLLSKGFPFVAYRLPKEKAVNYVVQTSPVVKQLEFSELDNFTGFVIAPYLSYQTENFLCIHPDLFFAGEIPDFQKTTLASLPNQRLYDAPENRMVSQNEYLAQAKNLMATMKKGAIQKVVLSRYFSQKTERAFTPEAFFSQLCTDYLTAFVYLFYLPRYGVWAGATPETLLQKKESVYETVALAGTQLFSKNLTWEKKEWQEQQYVEDFIEMQLQSLGISNYKKGEKESIKAGKLAHLRTRFQIDESVLRGKVAPFIHLLHPTPAVGGLPQQLACGQIAVTEKHFRRFYTGFLGPWNLNKKQHLFVNLRCAEIGQNHLGIYVGGGITAASDPHAEWNETVNKSQTLLSVAKKIRTFAP